MKEKKPVQTFRVDSVAARRLTLVTVKYDAIVGKRTNREGSEASRQLESLEGLTGNSSCLVKLPDVFAKP